MTNETTPYLIWLHEATLAAIRKGADAEVVRAVAGEFAPTWYQAGEPIWMAADSLAFVAKQRAKVQVAP